MIDLQLLVETMKDSGVESIQIVLDKDNRQLKFYLRGTANNQICGLQHNFSDRDIAALDSHFFPDWGQLFDSFKSGKDRLEKRREGS